MYEVDDLGSGRVGGCARRREQKRISERRFSLFIIFASEAEAEAARPRPPLPLTGTRRNPATWLLASPLPYEKMRGCRGGRFLACGLRQDGLISILAYIIREADAKAWEFWGCLVLRCKA